MSDSACEPPWIGFDIGGANLKLYHTSGVARSVPFAMWKHPERLVDALHELVSALPAANTWLVTMTGELADCFEDRAAGVRFIVGQVQQAAMRTKVRSIRYYAVTNHSGADGGFVDASDALSDPYRVASANWHAMAQYIAAESNPQSHAIMIDIGSTTTDLIPIEAGKVATTSQTDFDRLAAGELLYLGGERTPVCSLVSELPWRGMMIPIMREFFADIGDCASCLSITGSADEAETAYAELTTADGSPRTRDHARARMARMIGRDASQVNEDEAKRMAAYVVQQAKQLVEVAIDRLDPSRCKPLITVGHHRWLLSDNLLSRRTVFEACERADLSRVGPAFAICQLYRTDAARRG